MFSIFLAQRAMEKYMLGITRHNRKTYTWIREKTKVYDIIKKVKELKWKWPSHIARKTEGRWTKADIEWLDLKNYICILCSELA